MEIAKRNWRSMLLSADKTADDAYQFLDPNNERGNEHVIPIHKSLDKKRDAIERLMNEKVRVESEIAGLVEKDERVAAELMKHRQDFAREMLDLGIPSPLAVEKSE